MKFSKNMLKKRLLLKKEDWLKAMTLLYDWYTKGDRAFEFRCPLCVVTVGTRSDYEYYYTEISSCDVCVWSYFTGSDCEDYFGVYKGPKDKRGLPNTRDNRNLYAQWARDRGNQLYDWIEEMESW